MLFAHTLVCTVEAAIYEPTKETTVAAIRAWKRVNDYVQKSNMSDVFVQLHLLLDRSAELNV